MDDAIALSARAALASHRLVGWTYWDPVAIERYTALGIPDGFGFYVCSRAAPLLPAGHEVVTAAFATIHPGFVEACIEVALGHTTAEAIYEARCAAVADGLRAHAPGIVDRLGLMAEPLWAVADQLDSMGRVMFASHRGADRHPGDPALSAWLAVNCLREWRGDTHFAVLVAEGISPVAAGILDDARRNYGGWIPRSRGADDGALSTAFDELEARGLASDGVVTVAGLEMRERIEQRTDELTWRCWELLGIDRTEAFCTLVEEVGEALVARIDATAGPQWMPAARDLDSSHVTRGGDHA